MVMIVIVGPVLVVVFYGGCGYGNCCGGSGHGGGDGRGDWVQVLVGGVGVIGFGI